jgi:hypothetical protein
MALVFGDTNASRPQWQDKADAEKVGDFSRHAIGTTAGAPSERDALSRPNLFWRNEAIWDNSSRLSALR